MPLTILSLNLFKAYCILPLGFYSELNTCGKLWTPEGGNQSNTILYYITARNTHKLFCAKLENLKKRRKLPNDIIRRSTHDIIEIIFEKGIMKEVNKFEIKTSVRMFSILIININQRGVTPYSVILRTM